jgi:Ras association (RalGDS/AF-6) domain
MMTRYNREARHGLGNRQKSPLGGPGPKADDRPDNSPTISRISHVPTPALDTPSAGASVEIFKTFRVSIEDPCYKVLPAALKKYNINAPPEQYALYIAYEDKERCLGRYEKPLVLFKQLDEEGKKPMFILRKIGMADTMNLPSRGRKDPFYDLPGSII